MARNTKLLEGFNETIEEWGCALGDAEDFLDRVETMTSDLIDAVAAGRVGAAEAKRRITQEYSGARSDLLIWRQKRLADAFEYKYQYLDRSQTPFPFIRIITQLPADKQPEGAA